MCARGERKRKGKKKEKKEKEKCHLIPTEGIGRVSRYKPLQSGHKGGNEEKRKRKGEKKKGGRRKEPRPEIMEAFKMSIQLNSKKEERKKGRKRGEVCKRGAHGNLLDLILSLPLSLQ